jgi:hypothetical protein
MQTNNGLNLAGKNTPLARLARSFVQKILPAIVGLSLIYAAWDKVWEKNQFNAIATGMLGVALLVNLLIDVNVETRKKVR